MAIQHRRGVFNKFDPTKLLPGEYAVVLSGDDGPSDGKAVYICFAAGDVKRIATVNDMAEYMDQMTEEVIEEITAEVEAATQAATEAASDASEAASEASSAATAAQEAAQAAEAIVDYNVPLMSSTQRGGAKLGSGLSMDGEALNLGPLTDSGRGASVQTDGCGIFGVTGEGYAEQDTTTGKNLLNVFTLFANTSVFSLNADGSEIKQISGDGTSWVSLPYIQLSSGTYTLSVGNVGEATIAVASQTSLVNDLVYTSISSNNGHASFTISQTGYLRIRLLARPYPYPKTHTNLQLETGSTATAYEPYTGGKASPNPDYPQEIRVARGRNLVDPSTFIAVTGGPDSIDSNGYFKDSTSTADTRTWSYANRNFGLTLPSGTYTVSFAIKTVTGSSSAGYSIYSSGGTLLVDGSSNYEPHTFTLASETTIGVMCKVFAGVMAIQIEEGSTPTPYVPYGHIGLDITANGQTTTTPIPLPSKGFAAKVGDYADTLEVDSAGGYRWVNETEEYTFTGSETSTDTVSLGDGWMRANIQGVISGKQSIIDSAYGKFTHAKYLANWSQKSYHAYATGGSIYLFAEGSSLSDVLTTYSGATILYPLRYPTTESSYIQLPELPAGATVSIPELEAIGVEWWVEGAEGIAEHGRDVSKAAHELSEKLSTLEAAVATLATS